MIDDLGAGPIGLDTAVFIISSKEHAEFLPLVEPLFVSLTAGRWSAVTVSLTLLETLVRAVSGGRHRAGERYEACSHVAAVSAWSSSTGPSCGRPRTCGAVAVKNPTPSSPPRRSVPGVPRSSRMDRDLPPIPGLRILHSATTSGPRRRSRNADPEANRAVSFLDCHRVIRSRCADRKSLSSMKPQFGRSSREVA